MLSNALILHFDFQYANMIIYHFERNIVNINYLKNVAKGASKININKTRKMFAYGVRVHYAHLLLNNKTKKQF